MADRTAPDLTHSEKLDIHVLLDCYYSFALTERESNNELQPYVFDLQIKLKIVPCIVIHVFLLFLELIDSIDWLVCLLALCASFFI